LVAPAKGALSPGEDLGKDNALRNLEGDQR